jgi:hypothetical protein
MTTKVIDIEDTMPYEEVLTAREVAADVLLNMAEEVQAMATYYRREKHWSEANEEAAAARELERIAKFAEPVMELANVIRKMEHMLETLRETSRLAAAEVNWHDKKMAKSAPAKVAQPAAVRPVVADAAKQEIKNQTDAAIAKYDAAEKRRAELDASIAAAKAAKRAANTAPKALTSLPARAESTPESD